MLCLSSSFFTPKIFQDLGRLSFIAQQMLLPEPKSWESAWAGDDGLRTVNITGEVTRGHCPYSWTDYYNSNQRSQYHTPTVNRSGSDCEIRFRTHGNAVPPCSVGSSNVDYMSRKDDGIWYPDQLTPRMAWYGGSKHFDGYSDKEINPFAKLDHFIVVSAFTERLSGRAQSLQWAMIQPENDHIPRTRGNKPYATQNAKPAWLSKREYVAFTNMRAFPLLQLRNILVAVHERQLPFDDDSVHALIHQSLYHIGSISTLRGVKFEWKYDLAEPGFGKGAYTNLQQFYNEVNDSPTKFKRASLIARLSNFFSCHCEPKCRHVARKIAEAIFTWANALEAGIVESTSATLSVLNIRVKQVVLYQNAVKVLLGGSLVQDDVALLIKMIIKAKNLFTGDESCDEVAMNWTEIFYSMSHQMEKIVQTARHSPTILTDALRSAIQLCPNNLVWQNWSPSSGELTQCFLAIGNDGNHYTLNVASGEILINGLPPSRLPNSILNNPLYQRTFGSQNFEVVDKGNFLETCQPSYGRFYRFSKASSLKIYELNETETETLELLDGINPTWAVEMPIRLKQMHSHWLLRDGPLIVLRGISFKDRDISFLIKLQMIGCSSGEVKCVRTHQKGENLLKLSRDLGKMDTLVLCQSKVLEVISKIEPKQFIHAQISRKSNGSVGLKFVLPRYHLSFALHQGKIKCNEITGFELQSQQQIDGTFRGLDKYLLLKQSTGTGQLIICPKGQISRELPGRVKIEVSSNCNEETMYYQYNLHSRFSKWPCLSFFRLFVEDFLTAATYIYSF